MDENGVTGVAPARSRSPYQAVANTTGSDAACAHDQPSGTRTSN
ncbi:hypothetical protein ACFQ60_10855 [Streptomyces zhihengii]